MCVYKALVLCCVSFYFVVAFKRGVAQCVRVRVRVCALTEEQLDT